MVTWTLTNSLAVIGLAGGFLAPIFGAIVSIISWFIDPVWHGVFLHQAATSLFFLAIPLLILGAHCLDLLDEEQKPGDEKENEGNNTQVMPRM